MFKQWDDFLKEHRGLCGAFLFLLAFMVFRGTMANGFVFDDSPLIVENPFILNPHFWKHIFTGDAWAFQGGHASFFYRPLQLSIYWLIYRLAGANPAPFHLVSFALYAASGWLVYRLGRELLKSELAAVIGASLWLVHPLHVEPVAWISALADLGAGFFCLLAFLVFLNAEVSRRGRFAKHILGAFIFLIALLFKEMALSFPLMLLVFWFFFPGAAQGGKWKEKAGHWCVYATAACVYVLIRYAVLGRLTALARPWKVSPGVFAAGLGLLGQHAKLFWLPIHLDAFRSFDLNSSFHSPWAWLTLAVLLVAVGLRRNEPRLGFLLAWWGVALLPVLDIRQLSFPQVADRFSYLPSVGLCLAIAYLCCVRLPQTRGMRSALVALAPPAFLFCFWTLKSIQGIPAWCNNETWTLRTSEQSPNSVVLHLRLAENLLFKEGNDKAALREYETARRLNQASSWPMAGFGYAYNNGLGRIALRQGRTDEAIVFFEKAVRVAPQFTEAYDLLGSTFFTRRDFAQAAGYFQHAVNANPYDLNAHFYLGTCWMKMGKFREAAGQFNAARTVDPAYIQAFFAEAGALEAAGDPASAAKVRSLAENAR